MVAEDKPSASPSDPQVSAEDQAGRPDLAAFFDASPFATLLFTPDLVMIDNNAAHERLTGVPAEIIRGRPVFEVFPKNEAAVAAGAPDTEAVIRASVARAIEEGCADEPPVQRHDLPRDDGTFEPRYWRMIHSPVRDGDRIVAIRQDAWDVTDAIRLAERQSAMQRIAGTISGIAFWELDVPSKSIVRTPELDAIFGFPRPDPGTDDGATVGNASDLSPFMERVHPEDMERLAQQMDEMVAAGGGTVRQMEYRVIRPSGEERRVATYGEVSWGEEGQPVIIGTSLDVTELHANERRLERLLAEKEILLGEVNHRVKNSLQLVSSILSLEARSAGDGERARLLSAAARVQAVSAVHAAFYHDEDVRSVEFSSQLDSFCEQLAESLGAEERGIALRVVAEQASIPADRAVPLSLIVNELVTNAFKYAFPVEAPEGAAVVVTFKPQGSASFALTVADNGAAEGTEPGAAASRIDTDVPSSRTGLGTRLITALARQIGATVQTWTDGGWHTEVRFDA